MAANEPTTTPIIIGSFDEWLKVALAADVGVSVEFDEDGTSGPVDVALGLRGKDINQLKSEQ